MSEMKGTGFMCRQGNHVYVFAGTHIPDGWPCACGMTRKHNCMRCHGSGIEPSIFSNEPLSEKEIALGKDIAKRHGLEQP